MSLLVSATPLACIKTPVRYLHIYTGWRLCGTHYPQQILCDMKCTFASHNNGSATPATHNDRTRKTPRRIVRARHLTPTPSCSEGDPTCNPFLAFVATLTAGMEGVLEGIEPPIDVDGNIYHDARRAGEGRDRDVPGDYATSRCIVHGQTVSALPHAGAASEASLPPQRS